MTRAVLVRVSDEGLGRKYVLPESCLIGRADDADIQLVDALVSKQHARVTGGVIEDLGSRNGVSVNGVKIAAPTKLSANDVVGIGHAAFVFCPDLEVLPAGDKTLVLLEGDIAGIEVTQAGLVAPDLAPIVTASLSRGPVAVLEAMRAAMPFDSAGIVAPGLRAIASADRSVMLPKQLIDRAYDEPVILADASASTTYHGQKQLRSVLAVPLQLAGGVVFFHRHERGYYGAAAAKAVMDVAPLLALAVGFWRERDELSSTVARREAAGREDVLPLVGEGADMVALKAMMQKAAAAPSPVLILGESGTGKELVARRLHNEGPFVAINCGAIPENLMESELFGYEAGAFTGASKRTIGKLEAASGGTLFLDEIGELPLSMQVKLLRALQEKEIHRLGGVAPVPVSFRLVAATHRDLASSGFRQDLYFRIAVITLKTPPLRAHSDDIPALVEHLIAALNRELRTRVRGVDADAMALLRRYRWPGNVRELKNVLERSMVLAEGAELGVADLPSELFATERLQTGDTMPARVEAFERKMIIEALKRARGKKVAAAQALGISRPTLDKKIKDYGIDLFGDDA